MYRTRISQERIMYTWEIEKKLNENNFNIKVEDYIKICNTSPQITRCSYNPYSGNFQLWADGKNYIFKVHR